MPNTRIPDDAPASPPAARPIADGQDGNELSPAELAEFASYLLTGMVERDPKYPRIPWRIRHRDTYAWHSWCCTRIDALLEARASVAYDRVVLGKTT